MNCSRCGLAAPYLVTCYWEETKAICSNCCTVVSDKFDQLDRWPAIPVPDDVSELTL